MIDRQSLWSVLLSAACMVVGSAGCGGAPPKQAGEDNNFDTRSQQCWDNVALQEVNDCHAMVGGDEDFFGHESFLDSKMCRQQIYCG